MSRSKRAPKYKRRKISDPISVRALLKDESPFQCKTCIQFNGCLIQSGLQPDKWCDAWLPERLKYFEGIAAMDLEDRIKILTKFAEAMPGVVALLAINTRLDETDSSLIFTLNKIERGGGLLPYRTLGGHRRYSLRMLNQYLNSSRRSSRARQ